LGVMNFFSELPNFCRLACCTCIEVNMRLYFVQMAAPAFYEVDIGGTVRFDGLHWEGFPRLAWETL
jgi:hypothetical protein